MQKLKTSNSVTKDSTSLFKQVCLHCGSKNNSPLYSCDCRNEDWVHQYRSIDIQFDADRLQPRQEESFRNYSFHNLDGILQYEGLPYGDDHPEGLETIGLTPLYELRYLSREYGFRMYLKNEGDNPSGCFKDRESMMCYLNSRSCGLKKSVIYSSGNAAASAAFLIENNDHDLITFVAGDTYPEKIEYIRNHGSDVVVIGDEQVSYEEGYRIFSEINSHGDFADHGYDNWSVRNPYRVQGDKTIALEIIKQLSPYNDVAQVPNYVLIPTANGSCLAGMWKGFKELKQAGVIPALPRLISVGITGANPVNKAVRQQEVGRPVRCDLSDLRADHDGIGSIIRAEEGYDSVEAAKSVIESGGAVIDIDTSDLKRALVDFLEQEGFLAIKKGILPEPASLTSLAAARKLKEELSISKEETVVSLITGHGLKAAEVIDSMLDGHPILKKKVKQVLAVRENKMRSVSAPKGDKFQVEANLGAIGQVFSSLQK